MNQLPFTKGTYRTAPRKVSPLAAMFPSLMFYPHLFRSIFRASAVAKRGCYGDRQWCETSLELFRALENVGVEFEVTGIDRLEGLESPCVIVANHMSTLETAVLPAVIQPIKNVTFVVKQALVDYPVFKHVMRARRPIAVTQTDARADLKTMLLEGAERLERGISVVVFPQGRRTAVFDPALFNTIGVKLAHRAGVPIVPLALSTGAWALGHRRLPDFGKIDPRTPVRFAFGPPSTVSGRGAGENLAIIEFITQKLDAWQIPRVDWPTAVADPNAAVG